MPQPTAANPAPSAVTALAAAAGRYDADRARSAKRLNEVTGNGLAPGSKVTNVGGAFMSHLLAIGVVGGLRGAARNEDGDRRGPRVPGLVFDRDEGRFSTPHTVLTYTTGVPGRPLVLLADSIPLGPFAVKLFSSGPDVSAVGGRPSRTDPATRVLAFDFDKKQHSAEAARDEVLALCRILHEAGLYNWIVDISPGGFHVLVMLNRPVRLSDVRPFFEAIAPAFRTLDIQPMTGVHGAISVPYSEGKSKGSRRQLAHPVSASFTGQLKANRFSGWERLSKALLAGIQAYDREHLRAMTFDLRAARLAKAAEDMWASSVAVRHRRSSSEGRDGRALERRRLEAVSSRTYTSPSEERFALAGAMIAVHGISDASIEASAGRLESSADPLPARYRQLVAIGAGRLSVAAAARKDLANARAKSDLPDGWVGLAHGSTVRSVSAAGMIELTDASKSLAARVVQAVELGQIDYTELAVLRAYLQFANARHAEHLREGEGSTAEDPYAEPMPFALSMVARMTGLARRTAYDRTMACPKARVSDEDASACRAAGAERGLFCLCHERWQPFFEVAHLGHGAETDRGSRAGECRDHAYCSRADCEGRARSATFVRMRTAAGLQPDESSWAYQYLRSRDPIFNESALGAAGFHFHSIVSAAEAPVYLRDLDEAKLPGRSAASVVSRLTEAGLVGRSAARGRLAGLTANPVEEGSLAYRLHHERSLHAADQHAQMRSGLMGTGDITAFVLGFAEDPQRLHAVARTVLSYEPGDGEHEPAALCGPDGRPVRTLKEFCLAHGLPAPRTGDERLSMGRVPDYDADCASEHRFAYSEGDAERWDRDSAFSRVHWRDDFVAAARVLEVFDTNVLGSSFTPSAVLKEMFADRRRAFILTQECIMEAAQMADPPPRAPLLAAA